MIMTYDFILYAKRDKDFMKQLRNAVLNDFDNEIYTDTHILSFQPKIKTVIIKAKPDINSFRNKIVPKKVTYSAFIKMLDGDWENINTDDIIDFD